MTTMNRLSLFASESTNESDHNLKSNAYQNTVATQIRFISPPGREKRRATLSKGLGSPQKLFLRSMTLPEEKPKRMNNSARGFYHQHNNKHKEKPKPKIKKTVHFAMNEDNMICVDIIDVESFKQYYQDCYHLNYEEGSPRKVSCSCSCIVF